MKNPIQKPKHKAQENNLLKKSYFLRGFLIKLRIAPYFNMKHIPKQTNEM